MKENELRECAVCDQCGNKIGYEGNINFYRVTVKSYILNVGAIQRQDGLAMMMGSSQLANVMGTDEEMAIQIDEKTITVCADCITEPVMLTILEGGSECQR